MSNYNLFGGLLGSDTEEGKRIQMERIDRLEMPTLDYLATFDQPLQEYAVLPEEEDGAGLYRWERMGLSEELLE